jgi:SNF2 family DNA or RNA helicase
MGVGRRVPTSHERETPQGLGKTVQVLALIAYLMQHKNNSTPLPPPATPQKKGLGKTVQVLALIAYLMQHKNNYGPHLVVVPNAVMSNWKDEIKQWLPNARLVYYKGTRQERATQFNKASGGPS